eukprot:COSAG01_NODE_22799_length_840_cov_10.184885_1_plen_94_part_00
MDVILVDDVIDGVTNDVTIAYDCESGRFSQYSCIDPQNMLYAASRQHTSATGYELVAVSSWEFVGVPYIHGHLVHIIRNGIGTLYMFVRMVEH